MERETRIPQLIQPFQGSDRLASETTTPEGVWSQANGVIKLEGAATRMNGKTAYDNAETPILAFAQLGDFIIVQTTGTVRTVLNSDFF